MRRPETGKFYRLTDKDGWTFHRAEDAKRRPAYMNSKVKIVEGEILLCLESDASYSIKFLGEPALCHSSIWLRQGAFVYDTPVLAVNNNGREDNVMEFMVELVEL